MASTQAIPQDVLDIVRSIFAEANLRVSYAMSTNPNLKEEFLDMKLISELGEMNKLPILSPITKWRITIDTHFLGSRWMYGRWEVADIGVLVNFRSNSRLIRSKVGLLQSKRLYSDEVENSEPESEFAPIGFGSLLHSEQDYQKYSSSRRFTFTVESRYGALAFNDHQARAIREYARNNRMPIYYLFYNPHRIPFVVDIPAVMQTIKEPNMAGCRVEDAEVVRAIVNKLKRPPSYAELGFDVNSYALEDFVEDLLQCKKGRVVTTPNDEDLERLFYSRSNPISAALSITVDAPNDIVFSE